MSESNDYVRQRAIPLEVKIRTLVKDIRFNVVGTVSKVNNDGTRIDVTLPYLDCNMQPVVLKGIEILRPGTHNIVIKYKPVVGDVALVFAMQDYWVEGQFNHQPEKQSVKAEPYSNVTMKAILVQTNEENTDATILDVKEDEITITAPLKTTITCKDAVTITAESTTKITCKENVTVDASDQNVVVKASTVSINDHLTVE